MLTFKFRLYPSKAQQAALWKDANKLNSLYNDFLKQKIDAYQKDQTNLSRFALQSQLVALKKSDSDLKRIHSQVLQQVPKRLSEAYDSFFQRIKSGGPAGFPKFRSCKNFFGICYPQSGFYLEKKFLKIKAYGKIPLIQHQEIKGKIKQIYISCKNNKYYVSITTDYTLTHGEPNGKAVGIDIGLKNLVVGSDGLKIENCTHSKYFDKKIESLQSRRDKKKKGSRRYKELSKTIRRLYDVKTRKINDFQHKVSKDLSRKYDTIYAEDLSVKSMTERSKKTGLNKAVRNAKFSQFLRFLAYKARNLILVNPYNTSKTCNKCGKIHENLKLSDRTISCDCGEIYDRDENAAKNIFCLGQAIFEKEMHSILKDRGSIGSKN